MRVGHLAFVFVGALACGDDGTLLTDDEAGGDPDPPGPTGQGCNNWEPDAPDNAAATEPEFWPAAPRAGRVIEFEPTGHGGPLEVPRPRGLLLANDSPLSTPRGAAMSWCVGGVTPNPLGPGGSINEELDAKNFENYQKLLRFMEAAARAWERHGKINFVRTPQFDDPRKSKGGNCNPALDDIWFRVETATCDAIGYDGNTNANGETEFDPIYTSPSNPNGLDRYLCLLTQKFSSKPLSATNARHELGHILGLSHEHLRVDQAGAPSNCKIDSSYPNLPLTPFDPKSVMGYEECNGMEGIEPKLTAYDRMAVFYLHHWQDRRTHEVARSLGGEDFHVWDDSMDPGLLWYRHGEPALWRWRTVSAPGDPLEFEASERCVAGEPPCEPPVTPDPRWKPVVGQFANEDRLLDVMLIGGDDVGEELLLRNTGPSFAAVPKTVHGRPVPVVGQFLAGNRDQLLLYGPGDQADEIWRFADDGSHEVVPIERDGYLIPIPGKFRGPSGATDIVWWDSHGGTAEGWAWSLISPFEYETTGSFLPDFEAGAEYMPLVGDFDGDLRTDIFWYAPGEAIDQLWLSESTPTFLQFVAHSFDVEGDYHPFIGDFDGDEVDDIFWARSNQELDSGSSLIWHMHGSLAPEPRGYMIQKDYSPYVADFDRDGCSDILWYEAHRPSQYPFVWTCLDGAKDFDCQNNPELPIRGYLVGWNGGGY